MIPSPYRANYMLSDLLAPNTNICEIQAFLNLLSAQQQKSYFILVFIRRKRSNSIQTIIYTIIKTTVSC